MIAKLYVHVSYVVAPTWRLLVRLKYRRIASVSVSVKAETVISFGAVAVLAETENVVSAAVSVTAVRTLAISAPLTVLNVRHVAAPLMRATQMQYDWCRLNFFALFPPVKFRGWMDEMSK